jgi:hypothetical protein
MLIFSTAESSFAKRHSSCPYSGSAAASDGLPTALASPLHFLVAAVTLARCLERPIKHLSARRSPSVGLRACSPGPASGFVAVISLGFNIRWDS